MARPLLAIRRMSTAEMTAIIAPNHAMVLELATDKEVHAFDLNETFRVAVGRHHTNDIRLRSRRVSSYHAEILSEVEGLFVRDLGSTNGTRLAGQKLAKGKRTVLETGKNLFACAPEDDPHGIGLTPLGYSFVAGILKHGRALCAVFAPTVNSYKRLVRRGAMSYFSWAPVFNSWGSNNRTNSVRIPSGGGRCESRNADGAVNPYLAATLALAAGLEGIREGLNPGNPNEDNLYAISDDERRARGIEFLPQTLQEAVEAFAADPLVEATLGKGLRDEFIRYKTEEWEAYHLSVSTWEVERYSYMF